MSSISFEQFYTNCLIKDSSVTSTIDIHNEYINYTGSKTGRNNLYKYLESIEGVTREKNSFVGISIKKDNLLKSNENIEDKPDETKHVETFSEEITDNATKEMSAFEKAMLQIAKEKEERKAREAAAKEARKLNEAIAQKEKEEREAIAQKEKEERQAIIQKEKEEREAIAQKEKEDRQAIIQKEIEEIKAKAQRESEERQAIIQKEIEEIKAKARKESEERKALLKKEIAEMNNASNQKIAQMYIDDKENDRRLIREENSKNRQMYLTTKFNKYLDLKVYGSPAKQYITEESLIDVVGYDNYAMTSKINIKEIQEDVKKVSEDVIIYETGKAKEVKAIDVKNAKKLLEDIKEVSEDLKEKVDKIPEVAVRDENRNIISKYEEKKNVIIQDKINGVKHAKLDKIKYRREENELKSIGNDIIVKCSCCKISININEDGCHRGHNIPASDGGDWSKDNIYLICATCNLNMSDKMSIDDYKVKLYVEKLEESGLNSGAAAMVDNLIGINSSIDTMETSGVICV